MTEQQQPTPPRTPAEQVAQTDWKVLGEQLGKAMTDLGKVVADMGKRQREAREIGALFALHQNYRFRPEGAPPRDETLALLQAAMDGYDPEYLERLVMFGGFIAEHAARRYHAGR